jgi:hypothetical protein
VPPPKTVRGGSPTLLIVSGKTRNYGLLLGDFLYYEQLTDITRYLNVAAEELENQY